MKILCTLIILCIVCSCSSTILTAEQIAKAKQAAKEKN